MEHHTPTLPGPGQRSLAAIVFTDVVSFSARMQTDEVTTLRLLKRDFAEMREVCTQHHGSVLKSTGDGLLLYFSSAVQAVACALAMQRAFAVQAKNRPVNDNLTHRIGIHLGDVFMNDQDVMGDGVNIAARLQAEAEPGGICISQTVYDVVRNKLALQVTRLSPRELKNISQAIPIYKLLLEAQAIGSVEPDPPPDEELQELPPPAHSLTRAQKAMAAAALALLVVAVVFSLRALSRHRQVRVEDEESQSALVALMKPHDTADSILPADRITATLAAWREEFRDKRSRSMVEYNFAEMAQSLRDTQSPVAGKPEAKVRAQVLQRIQVLFGWLATALQKYSREKPLVIRELTGTAPKEIKVYVGADRRLYYAEGGAIRQKNWGDVPPPVLAAIIVGAIRETEPLPSREVVLGALAFGNLYKLPELTEALRQGRNPRTKR